MNVKLRLPAIASAAALLFGVAAPASACTLMGISPPYVNRVAREGQAVWVGRVSVVTPEPRRSDQPMRGPGGKVTIVLDTPIRGHAKAEFQVNYDTAPYCGVPWDPKVGDRLLVVQFPTYPQLFAQNEVGGSLYAHYFTKPK